MLSRLRLGPKLLLAPALVLVLLVVSSVVAYWAMQRQNQLLETIVQVRAARIHDATALVAQAQAAHARSYQLLTWIGASVSAPRIAALENDIHRRHAALENRFVQLATRSLAGSVERTLLEQAQAAHAVHARAVRDVIDLARGDGSVAASAMVKAEQAFEREALRLAALAGYEQQQSEASVQHAAQVLCLIRLLMPALAALSLLLSLAITVAVRRALLREVRGIGQAAKDLAGGDLTVRTRDYGGDEISETSRTLDASIRTLNATLKDILASARLIDTTSREIAIGNAELSNRAGLQASSLEPTRLTMEQLSATISLNAGHARAATHLSANAAHRAHEGGDVLQRLARAMATLALTTRPMTELLDAIDQQADQAGLLALKAAARRLRALVEQSMAQIAGGSVAAAEAGANMAEIVNSVRQVGDMISKISASSAAQASGMSHMNCAIVQMDHMTQENCARVEEAAAAASSLQTQALSLSQAVATFKLDEGTVQCDGGKPRLWLASKRE